MGLMRNSVLASRYAKALFELSLDIDNVDGVNQDLENLVQMLEDNPKLAEVFTHPRLSRDEKFSLMNDYHGLVYESEYVRNFLHLLIQKKRERELANIFSAWMNYFHRYKQVLPVEVVAVSKLTDKQVDSLRSRLIKKTKREPMFSFEMNPQLLGGMIIRYEDKIIDGSVLKQIQQLTASIKDIPVAKLRGEVV